MEDQTNEKTATEKCKSVFALCWISPFFTVIMKLVLRRPRENGIYEVSIRQHPSTPISWLAFLLSLA